MGYRDFSCDLCGDTRAIEIPHVRKYTDGQVIHICKNCGFIYVKKRRSYDEITEVWSKKLFGKAYTSRTPLMLARHTYVAEFIDQNLSLKNKKVCDVGAGEGQFLSIAKNNYGARVFGIEHSAANCGILKKSGIGFFQGAIEDYVKSRPGYRADIATVMWTLENTASPRDMLMCSRHIIKDGGYIVIATGSRILAPFSKPLSLYLSSYPADTHPSRFSVNTLTALLAVTGYKVTHINPYLNDSLVLCVIAKKSAKLDECTKIKGDDFRKVRDFFERWHKETKHYTK